MIRFPLTGQIFKDSISEKPNKVLVNLQRQFNTVQIMNVLLYCTCGKYLLAHVMGSLSTNELNASKFQCSKNDYEGGLVHNCSFTFIYLSQPCHSSTGCRIAHLRCNSDVDTAPNNKQSGLSYDAKSFCFCVSLN